MIKCACTRHNITKKRLCNFVPFNGSLLFSLSLFFFSFFFFNLLYFVTTISAKFSFYIRKSKYTRSSIKKIKKPKFSQGVKPIWRVKTKEGKNNSEERLFSLSLFSLVGCPFTMLYLPLTHFSITQPRGEHTERTILLPSTKKKKTHFSIIQSWKIAIVLHRERELLFLMVWEEGIFVFKLCAT